MTDKIIYKVSPRHLRPPTRWLRTTFQTSCPTTFFLIPLLWVKVDYSLIDENVINFFTYNFVHIIQFPGASSTASTSHLSLQMILRIFQEFVKISHYQEFPGGSVFQDFAFQCRACGFNPWSESIDITCLMTKKQKCKQTRSNIIKNSIDFQNVAHF